MIRLTERLPPRCLSPRVRSGRIRLGAVITSIFQNDLHPMTSSDILNARQCFLVQVSEDAVQQGLRSNCTERGEGWEGGRGVAFLEKEGQGSYVLKHLTCRRTCTASLSRYALIFAESAPTSLCCHFGFALTYAVIRLNACGCHTYCFTRACPSSRETSPIN